MRAPAVVRVPFCGLPCPPLRIDATAGGGRSVSGGCRVAREAAGRVVDPRGPRRGGTPVDHAAALQHAAAILAAAKRPFVGGLAWSTTGTARRAVRLADRLGAALDIEGGEAAAVESEAIAMAGLSAATFGAVRDRADVVLLWRCDPRPEHPELLPPRRPAAADGAERRVIRLGAEGPSAPGDLEALAALRALALERAPHLGASAAGARAGSVDIATLRAAALALREARHAAILWDARAVTGSEGPATALALALLARDLDDRRGPDGGRRAVARPLGGGGNVAGALSAILSERGHARRLGASWSADAVLLVGARRRPAILDASGVPPRLVVVGPGVPEGVEEPEVHIPAAVPGLSGGGLWMRADGIALPVRNVVPASDPSEEAILDDLLDRLQAATAAGARPPAATAEPPGAVR